MRIEKRLLYFCLLLMVSVLISACGATSSPLITKKLASTLVVAPATSTSSAAATPETGKPTRLLVPEIGVDAPIEDIGVLPNGNLATPTQNPWEGVGWYTGGPYPGAVGSAVIAGHLDRPGGAPAVFWYLRNLHPGDSVMVVSMRGTMLRFRVTRVVAYPPNEAPLQDIFGNTGGKYLNLITCAGDWVPSEQQTTLRLVVYTSQV